MNAGVAVAPCLQSTILLVLVWLDWYSLSITVSKALYWPSPHAFCKLLLLRHRLCILPRSKAFYQPTPHAWCKLLLLRLHWYSLRQNRQAWAWRLLHAWRIHHSSRQGCCSLRTYSIASDRNS